MICVEAYDALWMFFFRKKDPFFLNATYFVATFFVITFLQNSKSSIPYMASILACHYKKNMLFLRTKISFFQIFLLPFFCAKFCHNLLVFMTILHKKKRYSEVALKAYLYRLSTI